jgi:hypothetical protein
MLRIFRSAVLIAALPMLAVFGLLFRCFLLLIACVGRLFRWEIVWPPVLADELEAEPDDQEHEGMARL